MIFGVYYHFHPFQPSLTRLKPFLWKFCKKGELRAVEEMLYAIRSQRLLHLWKRWGGCHQLYSPSHIGLSEALPLAACKFSSGSCDLCIERTHFDYIELVDQERGRKHLYMTKEIPLSSTIKDTQLRPEPFGLCRYPWTSTGNVNLICSLLHSDCDWVFLRTSAGKRNELRGDDAQSLRHQPGDCSSIQAKHRKTGSTFAGKLLQTSVLSWPFWNYVTEQGLECLQHESNMTTKVWIRCTISLPFDSC